VETLWALLKGQAIDVSIARDAFNFEISWLGILIILAAMLLIRHLRR
jgi:hypothetical protein